MLKSILKPLADFILGKDPDIFDPDGSVRHDLPKQKWDRWNNRYQNGAEFNWRNHTGTKAGGEQHSNPKL